MKRVLVAAVTVGMAIVLSPAASAEPSWTMPNLIGRDLQGAQDAIQSLTHGEVWFSRSHRQGAGADQRSQLAGVQFDAAARREVHRIDRDRLRGGAHRHREVPVTRPICSVVAKTYLSIEPGALSLDYLLQFSTSCVSASTRRCAMLR